MSLKNDLKNIINDNSNIYISLFLPLYPDEDSFKLDDAEFDSLLAKSKQEYYNNYGKKGWEKFEEKIQNIKKDIIFDYAQSQSLAVIISENNSYHYYLPNKIQLQTKVGKYPYIIPIIKGYEFMPTYNILKIDQSGFKIFEVVNGLITSKVLPIEAPTNAKIALNMDITDEKIRIDQEAGQSGNDQYRGYDVRSEVKQSNMDRYFRIVDEYVIKHISLRDHLPVVLMANKADFGEFIKVSHNQYLDNKNMIIVPSIINHESLEKTINPINKKFIEKNIQKIKKEIDTSKSRHKYMDNMDQIQLASTEGRLDTLIIADEIIENETETKEEIKFNIIAINTIIYGGKVQIVNPKVIGNVKVIGILRGI